MYKSLFAYQLILYHCFGDVMKTIHKEKYKLLGLNIAYYRKLCGYTQEGLAEKLEIDRTTVSKIELATCGVSLDLLFDLSDVLGVPLNKLFIFRE